VCYLDVGMGLSMAGSFVMIIILTMVMDVRSYV